MGKFIIFVGMVNRGGFGSRGGRGSGSSLGGRGGGKGWVNFKLKF